MSENITSHRDLVVWQKSMNFVESIYSVTRDFPKEELFVLVAQMRRAAISIPSNIAEGRRRGTRKDYAHFIDIAFGSGAELETQIEIAMRIGYIDQPMYAVLEAQFTEIMKMLNALKGSLRLLPTT